MSPFVLAVLVTDDPVLVVLGGNFDFFVRARFSGSALLSARSGFTKPRHSLLFGSGVAEPSVSRAVVILIFV